MSHVGTHGVGDLGQVSERRTAGRGNVTQGVRSGHNHGLALGIEGWVRREYGREGKRQRWIEWGCDPHPASVQRNACNHTCDESKRTHTRSTYTQTNK